MRARSLTLGLASLLLTFAGACNATDERALTTKKVGENVYVVLGGNGHGSNVGVFVGRSGIVLVDAMVSGSSDELLQAVTDISDLPITHVLNTHGDSDHSGGNEYFAGLGAVVIGQENARFRRSYADSLFGEHRTLSLDSETIDMYHVVSHSFDDAIIVFRESNVVFMGDTFTTNWHPTLYSGGLDGQIAAVDLVLGLADSNTVVVPGHGFVSGPDALLKYSESTSMIVDRIGVMHQEGLSSNEMLDDPAFNRIMSTFNIDHSEVFVPAASRKRFIERVVSTEFVDRVASINLRRYEGVYALEDGRFVELSAGEGKLFAMIVGEFIVELVPQSASEFRVRGSGDDAFTFVADGSGPVGELSLTLGETSATGLRVPE